MRSKHMLAGAAALGLAGAAGPALGADAATYDYLEARYTILGDADTPGPGGGSDVTGLGLEGSRSFNEMFFVRLVSDMYNVEGNGSDSPLDIFSVGPGVRVPLNTPGTATLWGTFNYERASTGDLAATGFGFDVGLRMQLTDRIEGGFTVKSAATESGNTNVDFDTWELGGAYSVNRQIDLTASLVNGEVDRGNNTTDLDNLVRVGVRLPF